MKLIIAAALLIVTTQTSAQQFIATQDGDITATMATGNTDINSKLGLSIDGVQSSSYVSNLTDYAAITNFGFAHAGDVIVFNLRVIDTGYVWSSDMGLNSDGYIHYTYADGGLDMFIGFEAGYGYGDGSMDDNTAYFNNVSLMAAPVPEPETYVMMLVGLGLIGFAARKR